MSDDHDRADVSLGSLLDTHGDRLFEDLAVAGPGRVESYDAEAQVADVTPLVRRRIPRESGELVSEAMPTIRAVPVAWPRAGNWFLHMPLAAGDTVLLVFCDRDPARWRRTGDQADPIDVRLHHLSHAVAIPGVYPRTRQLGDTPAGALVIGRDGGSTIRILDNSMEGTGVILVGTNAAQFVALANLVLAELQALWTKFNAHTHAHGEPNTGVPNDVTGTAGPVAAAKVQAE